MFIEFRQKWFQEGPGYKGKLLEGILQVATEWYLMNEFHQGVKEAILSDYDLPPHGEPGALNDALHIMFQMNYRPADTYEEVYEAIKESFGDLISWRYRVVQEIFYQFWLCGQKMRAKFLETNRQYFENLFDREPHAPNYVLVQGMIDAGMPVSEWVERYPYSFNELFCTLSIKKLDDARVA